VGAMKLLEWEGFRFERTVDIFDGGPMLATRRKNIRTIQESRIVNVAEGTGEIPVTGLISNNRIEDYRCMQLEGFWQDQDAIVLSTEQIEALRLSVGDVARIWVRS